MQLLSIMRINFIVDANLKTTRDYNKKFCCVIFNNGQHLKIDLSLHPLWRFVKKDELVYKTDDNKLVPLFINKNGAKVKNIKKYLKSANCNNFDKFRRAKYSYKKLKVMRVVFDDEISLIGDTTKLETRVYLLVTNSSHFFPKCIEHKVDCAFWANIQEGDYIIHIPEVYGFFPLINGISEKYELKIVKSFKDGDLCKFIADVD